jgi:hypothetical protein
LRGRQGDTRVFLLVGDEATLASEPFAALRDAHERLLHDWASGSPDALHTDLAQCIALAQAHFPWLLSFYRAPGPRLSARKPAAVAAPIT